MSIRTTLMLVLVASLAASCAVIQPRVEKTARKLECDGSKECTVVVRVDCPRYFQCDLSVDYDVVVVLGRNRQVDIRWKLTAERPVEFANNGIVLDSSAFECRAEGKDAYVCHDKHSDFGVFKYGINVTVKEGVFGPRGVQSLDPWIVNH